MFNRIKILTLLQLSNRFKFKKIDNVKKFIAKVAILTLGVGLVTAVCTVIFILLSSLLGIKKPAYDPVWVINFFLVFLQILSIVACTLGLMKTLYTSKDNSILLSYPAHHVEVYISKLLVYYFYEFIKSIFFTLPLLIGFAIAYGYLNVIFVINCIIVLITLPIIPVFVGAIITLPIVYFKKLLNNYSFLKSIFIIFFMVGIFILFMFIIRILPRPLIIRELLSTILEAVQKSIKTVHKYSYCIKNISNIIVGENILYNYLVFFGIILCLFALIVLISMPIYFKLASQSSEHSTQKKRKGVNKTHKNTFFTFVKKEWLLAIRNIGDFIGDYIFTFATPYVFFIMMGLYSAMDLDAHGVKFTVIFSGFVMLLMCSASNTASALALTKEGSEFVLLKTVPSEISNMAWAKIFFHLVCSSIMIVVSYALAIFILPEFEIVTNGIVHPWVIEKSWLWLTMVAVLLINAGMVFWSFQIDIMNPKLREYASNGDSSGMNNASKSIMIGLIISLFFTLIVAAFFLVGSKSMTFNWSIILSISLAFFLVRLYMFISYLKNVFPYIEY